MDGEARELELKFHLDPDLGAQILAWLGQGRRETRELLTSTYYDTRRQDLQRAGFALRVRNDDGAWIQTVKSAALSDGRPGRGEWEQLLDGAAPDLDAVRQSPARRVLSRHAQLTPRFSLTIDRRAVTIRTPDCVIEACLDRGVAEAGAHRAAIDELELELKSGSPDSLFALARRLGDTWPVHLSVVTKADRGQAVAEARDLLPRHFQPPRLSRDMTAGTAFRCIARAAAEQICWNAELLRLTPTAEAVHQLRVGARRLRATLKTFKSIVSDAHLQGLRDRLSWLSHELDPARELDVFIDGIREAGDAPTADALRSRDEAYERARAAVAGSAFGALMLETLVWIEAGPWSLAGAGGERRRDRPAARFAAEALDRARGRLLKGAGHLSSLDVERRHRVRIQAKGLRYAADVFHQVFEARPKRTERLLSALESLLEALGDLNDIASARALAAGLGETRDAAASERRRERDLIDAAEDAAARLKRAKPFWWEKT